MIKKSIVSILILIGILSMNVVVMASGIDTNNNIIIEAKSNQQVHNYQVIEPKENSFATTEKVVLLSGKAPAGTTVEIKVLATTDLTRKNFNLNKLPEDKDYVSLFSDTIKVGDMGLFSKQLDLILGVNKIIVTFKIDSDHKVEKIIYVSDVSQAAESLEKIGGENITDIIVQGK
ncbi:hypothetical protein [Acidilutibacter cellobiosedens]|jgi:hypothetical protein|nr:hypothetical protein [Acidilutibacter cellobiosedens]